MNCHEARHLVSLGMEPGTADAVRTTFGFHLATCSACRTYRNQLHNQQLLYALLAQEPPKPEPLMIAPVTYAHRVRTGIRVASSALLVSGMLALSSFGAVAKAANVSTSVASAQLAPCVAAASHSASLKFSRFMSCPDVPERCARPGGSVEVNREGQGKRRLLSLEARSPT